MDFEWDEAKRRSNWVKHGVDFMEASQFDFETALTFQDHRHDLEERQVSIGFIGKRLHVTVFTKRKGIVRIISLRKANKREQAIYHGR